MRETKKMEITDKIVTREFAVDLKDGEEFFEVKRKDDQIDIDKLKIDPFRVSKNQLKKVRMDGIF